MSVVWLVIMMMMRLLFDRNIFISVMGSYVLTSYVLARDLNWPFLCACLAKKTQITSSDFLALKVPVSSGAEAGREESHRDVC